MSDQTDRALKDEEKQAIAAVLQAEAEKQYKLSLPARAGQRRQEDRRKGGDSRLKDRRSSSEVVVISEV